MLSIQLKNALFDDYLIFEAYPQVQVLNLHKSLLLTSIPGVVISYYSILTTAAYHQGCSSF